MRAAEHVPNPPEQRCLFFDLGASLYSFGTGGASLQWFVELCKCALPRSAALYRALPSVCIGSGSHHGMARPGGRFSTRCACRPPFVNALADDNRGCHFRTSGTRDRILAWEAKPWNASFLFASMPPKVQDVMSYYNVPVDTTPGARHNPWRAVTALAAPEDFVIVKVRMACWQCTPPKSML